MNKFVLTHQACECGSSDGRAYNEDGSSKCFVCGDYFPPVSNGGAIVIEEKEKKKVSNISERYLDLINGKTYPALVERNLSSETCKRYGIYAVSGTLLLSYYKDEALQAIKVRSKDKDFSIQGTWKDVGLFGQHLFGKSGKYVTITEGEIDAASAFQMMGSRYPVVSVRNGAGSALKDCKEQFEFLDSFANVIVCFDSDEVGQKAAKEVAELFGNKAKVVKLAQYKDANEYLMQNKAKDFTSAWWDADPFVPDGIVAGDSLWDLVNESVQLPDACYPWVGLNKMTLGLRLSELVTITAGSGLGKSQLLREIISHVLKTTDFVVGGLFLEENVKKTALSLMSLDAGVNLHLPAVEFTEDGWYTPLPSTLDLTGLRGSFDRQVGNGKLYLFDHFGSTQIDNIISRIKYMAKAMDCNVIILDHISIVVSGQENGDERKAIDEIMTRLRMTAQEMGILIIAVSHLKRPEGKGHEDGAATSLSQLRGSGSIAQLSDIVIGLERDSQSDDPIVRNTTVVRVLKNRFSGDTGKACDLLYDKESGRLTEYHPEPEEL